MRHVTAPRAAALAALLALAAGALAPSALAAFYLTAVAAAGLIGAGFFAYLAAVERPLPGMLVALVCITVAAALVMVEAALEFPGTLAGGMPDGPGMLVLGAVVLAAVALLTELPIPRIPLPDTAHLRELISR